MDEHLTSPSILIVEPNRSALSVMARRLAQNGYRITAADEATSAIGALYHAHIDLVLAELIMPRMNGAELALAMRGEVQWQDIPLLLMAGRSELKGAVRGYEAGADDVIAKPFGFEMLFARIDRRLDSARVVKRLREDNAALDTRMIERSMQIEDLRDALNRARIGDCR